MIDREEERISRVVRRLLGERRPSGNRLSCPDEETLAGYLGGLLPEAVRGKLETHLAACSLCLDDVLAVHKAGVEGESERVPQYLLERAMGLVKPQRGGENVLDLVVRLVKDAVELVATSGEWVSPLATAPVGVRGKPALAATSVLQVEKELGKYKVGVEVEQAEAGLCQVVVTVEENGKAVEGVRLSLTSGGREQASYLTRQGRALFDAIPPGEYALTVTDASGPAGTILLTIEESHHG